MDREELDTNNKEIEKVINQLKRIDNSDLFVISSRLVSLEKNYLIKKLGYLNSKKTLLEIQFITT